jgi:hypothetical protein
VRSPHSPEERATSGCGCCRGKQSSKQFGRSPKLVFYQHQSSKQLGRKPKLVFDQYNDGGNGGGHQYDVHGGRCRSKCSVIEFENIFKNK